MGWVRSEKQTWYLRRQEVLGQNEDYIKKKKKENEIARPQKEYRNKQPPTKKKKQTTKQKTFSQFLVFIA